MFNYLKTLSFYIFDVQSKGILFLEVCDIFNFVLNEVTYKTILLNNEIELDDGLSENYIQMNQRKQKQSISMQTVLIKNKSNLHFGR